MIVDLERFLKTEGPYWDELEQFLDGLDKRIGRKLTLAEVKRFHYLYQRSSTDLTRLRSFPAEPGASQKLSSLVARAYAEIHETRDKGGRFPVREWLYKTFPRTFRRHLWAFWLVCAVTLAGASFGGLAITLDPGSKEVIMPFPHLMMDPKKRVDWEESQTRDRLAGRKSSFSATLMTHNTRVSISTMALGVTWGIGTIILIFYNGVILGAVAMDYVSAGEWKFLAGWLLPHGVIEIPAILIAGQAGLLLGRALIGRGDPAPVNKRLRDVSRDLVTLIFGVGVLLVWAGVVEAFFSQYHEPVLPYAVKIAFGLVELFLLTLYLWRSGREAPVTVDEAGDDG